MRGQIYAAAVEEDEEFENEEKNRGKEKFKTREGFGFYLTSSTGDSRTATAADKASITITAKYCRPDTTLLSRKRA